MIAARIRSMGSPHWLALYGVILLSWGALYLMALPADLRAPFPDDRLTPYSDVVAHLVFDHQLVMMNILARVGWDFRVALEENRDLATLARTIDEAVEYLLFAGEAKWST